MNRFDTSIALICELIDRGKNYAALTIIYSLLRCEGKKTNLKLIQIVDNYLGTIKDNTDAELILSKFNSIHSDKVTGLVDYICRSMGDRRYIYLARILLQVVERKRLIENQNSRHSISIMDTIALATYCNDLQRLSLYVHDSSIDVTKLDNEVDIKIFAKAFFLLGEMDMSLDAYDALEKLRLLSFDEKIERINIKISLLKILEAKDELVELLENNKPDFTISKYIKLAEILVPLGLSEQYPYIIFTLNKTLKDNPDIFKEKTFLFNKIKNLISLGHKLDETTRLINHNNAFEKRFNSNNLNVEEEITNVRILSSRFPGDVKYKYQLLRLNAILFEDMTHQERLMSDIMNIDPLFLSVLTTDAQ